MALMSAVSILPLAVEVAWLIWQKFLLDIYDSVSLTDRDCLIRRDHLTACFERRVYVRAAAWLV